MQILYSVIVALALSLGFYFGFKLGRDNEFPKMKTIKQIKKEKEDEEDKNQLEKALNNLNKYDGTSKGQEEIV